MKIGLNHLMALVAFGSSAIHAYAVDKYWTGGSTIDSAPTQWSTTNNIWGTTTGTGGTVDPLATNAFGSGDNAIFEGTAATVRLGSAIAAGNITLGGYTINLDNNTAGAGGFNLTANNITGNGIITNSDSSTLRTFTWQPTADYSGTLAISGRTNLTLNATSAATTVLASYTNSGTGGGSNLLTVTQGVLKLTGSTTTANGIILDIGANGTLDLNGSGLGYRSLAGSGLLTNSSTSASTLTTRAVASTNSLLITGKINIAAADINTNTFNGAINDADLNVTSQVKTSNINNANYIFNNATRLGNANLGTTSQSSTNNQRSFNMQFLNANSAQAGDITLNGSTQIVAGGTVNAQSNAAYVVGGSTSTIGNVTLTGSASSANSTSTETETADGYTWFRLVGSGSTVGNVTMNGTYTVGTSGATAQTATIRWELIGSTGTIGNLVGAASGSSNVRKLVVLGNPTAGTASTLTLNTTSDSAFGGDITDATVTASNATLTGISTNFVNQATASTHAGAVGNLIKSGSATQTLSGTNTYSGTTTVNGGKLIINGSISTSVTTVNNGGALGGTGTVGAITIKSGGTLEPGNSTGILNAGNTSLEAGSMLGIEINSATIDTGYDQLNTTGTVSLAGLLSITMGYTPAGGTLSFILANDDADAISGVFSNASVDGGTYSLGGQQFEISYFGNQTAPGVGTFTGGNDVVLRAVPEPNAASLIGGLGTLMLLRRKRVRKMI